MVSTLLTDLYQLTMAYGYWKHGMAEREAVFHLFYRQAPFGGSACITAGITPAIEYLANLGFTDDELAYLSTLQGEDGRRLFDPGFIDYLRHLHVQLDVHAIPEGHLVFPHEPLLRIRGPLVQCQIVETALLNMVNFQTLVATKAARITHVANRDSVLEFGLRRAQGPDGALSASRAAYIGGCAATSNLLAGMRYGIPVKGTHAHSWVMSFDDEQEAFEAYADAMPNNVVLLVDTYDTLEGLRKAILVGKKLQEQGHRLLGVRLDSGDLVELSRIARTMLDEAGLSDAEVIASNDLDEHAVRDLKERNAAVGIWGIGTQLATAYDQPALGGVYKLGAITDGDGQWQPRVKLSNDPIKVSNPGILQVARVTGAHGEVLEDTIYDEELGRDSATPGEANLLQPALLAGEDVWPREALSAARDRAIASWNQLQLYGPAEVRLDPRVEHRKRALAKQHGVTA